MIGHLPFLDRLASLLVVGDEEAQVVRLRMGGWSNWNPPGTGNHVHDQLWSPGSSASVMGSAILPGVTRNVTRTSGDQGNSSNSRLIDCKQSSR